MTEREKIIEAMIEAIRRAPDCNSLDCNGRCSVCERNQAHAALDAALPLILPDIPESAKGDYLTTLHKGFAARRKELSDG